MSDLSAPAPLPFVELHGVEKLFGKNPVLRGIDLEVREHEVICLIGASGSGKSTLLRCINGLEPVHSGTIRVAGHEVTGRDLVLNDLRRDVGIVFQSFNLFPHMTVLSNITLAPRKVLKLSAAESEARAFALLDRIGMRDKAAEYPDRLSGGQQQRVAIVGRPNAGKSTLINHLLGEERLLTSAEAGTTRDSISVEVNWQGRDFRVFDTAGLRRRSRIEEKLEKLSVSDALRAIRFAEVVVLMMDAQNKFEEQDLRIADLIEREGRALVIAVNKWDLMGKQSSLIAGLRTDADHLLPQVKGMPITAVSGLMGEGIDRLMSSIEEAYAVWNRRVPTATLNRWFEQAIDANPPPAVSGRRLKLNYITQAKARPPSFILFCSRADAVPQSYLRYLVNSMREFFELPGTPVRIALREKANPFAHKRKRPS